MTDQETATSAEVLKPCPFCGGGAEIERVGTARVSTIYTCTSCSCSLETGEEWGHGGRWNDRPPAADWRPIDSAPKDGTVVLALCVHENRRYAKTPEEQAQWQEIVVTRWIDHNGGGWTWHGICGVHTHWMPLPAPPSISTTQ